MLFVDEFCGILVYIKFGADVTSQYESENIMIQDRTCRMIAENDIN